MQELGRIKTEQGEYPVYMPVSAVKIALGFRSMPDGPPTTEMIEGMIDFIAMCCPTLDWRDPYFSTLDVGELFALVNDTMRKGMEKRQDPSTSGKGSV